MAALLAFLLWFLAPTPALAQVAGEGSEIGPRDNPPPSRVTGEAVTTWLYAVDRGSSDGSSTLYRLGVTASGGSVDVQVVGETGVEDIFDIAFMGDRLIGIAPGAATFGTSDDVLVEIDPVTAATTGVATIDPSGNFNALVGESPTTLLGATDRGEIWRIDLDALRANRLGSFGSGWISSGDLAIAPDGTVFVSLSSGSDRLATVNLGNGRVTVRGSIGFPDVYGLAFRPDTGSLLGVADAQRDPRLVSIDTNTGTSTVIGSISSFDDVTGLAVAPGAAGPACDAGADAVFLQSGRFRIDACWRTPDGNSGTARLAQQAGIGATLWFFNPDNPELFLKVVNACTPAFNRYWVFLAGLTNVEVVVTFTDTVAGLSRTFVNSQGQPMQSVIDTSSFATCP